MLTEPVDFCLDPQFDGPDRLKCEACGCEWPDLYGTSYVCPECGDDPERNCMEAASHPPIPPNCLYFVQDENEWLFRAPNHWRGVLLSDTLCEEGWTHEHRDAWRPIIACIARCAWLDEGLNQSAKVSTSRQEYGDYCYNLAECWREWGYPMKQNQAPD